jgi:hypothetical protein
LTAIISPSKEVHKIESIVLAKDMMQHEKRTLESIHLPQGAATELGFKEWAIVCDSIGRGETSLLIRKGGIAEGREGFRFKYDRFFLFPSYFHEQIKSTRLAPDRDLRPQKDPVAISVFAEVEFTVFIRDLGQMEALEPLHVLSRAVIEQRFRYDNEEGLHLAFLRAFKLLEPWEFPNQPSFGGCRSWVTLPGRVSAPLLEPVLSDLEQEDRRELMDALR